MAIAVTLTTVMERKIQLVDEQFGNYNRHMPVNPSLQSCTDRVPLAQELTLTMYNSS